VRALISRQNKMQRLDPILTILRGSQILGASLDFRG
jgi:hypothetical protein